MDTFDDKPSDDGVSGDEVDSVEPRAAPADEPAGTASAESPAREERVEGELAATGGFQLDIPTDFPTSGLPGDYAVQLDEFSSVLAGAGVDKAIGQRLLNLYLDASQDNPFVYDTVGNDRDLVGPFAADDAADEMRKRWGGDYDANMALVRKGAAQLGDAFKQWLDDTGRGNDPGVLEAIAKWQSGAVSYTRETAQTKLDEIMQSPTFARPKSTSEGKRMAAEIRTLTRIVGEGGDRPRQSPRAAPVPTPRAASTRPGADRSSAVSTAAGARAQASAMLADKNGPLNNAAHPQRPEALKQFHQLLAKL